MEQLYTKLYEKYSKLKSTKENQIDQINQEQEVKFVEFVSAAEALISNLEAENKRLSENIAELSDEVMTLRSDKDQQFTFFQERLLEEKRKNHQLSAEMEQLRDQQQERTCFSNRSEQDEEQRLNSRKRSPTVFRGQADTSPRMTRTRARLAEKTDASPSSASVTPVRVSARRDLLEDQPNRDISKTDCCQGISVSGDRCNCLFQSLVETLTGMKVFVGDQSEGKCLRAVHPSSGYSFSLTWLNTSSSNEGEILYKVVSLGTLAGVATEWMKDVIIFSVNMGPVFFERVLRVIKHGL